MSQNLSTIIGSGFQVIDIDISASDPNLIAQIDKFVLRLHRDEDGSVINTTEIPLPASDEATPPISQVITRQITRPSIPDPISITEIRYVHDFKFVGLHILQVAFVDSNGNETIMPDAVRIGVGNGVDT